MAIQWIVSIYKNSSYGIQGLVQWLVTAVGSLHYNKLHKTILNSILISAMNKK